MGGAFWNFEKGWGAPLFSRQSQTKKSFTLQKESQEGNAKKQRKAKGDEEGKVIGNKNDGEPEGGMEPKMQVLTSPCGSFLFNLGRRFCLGE